MTFIMRLRAGVERRVGRAEDRVLRRMDAFS